TRSPAASFAVRNSTGTSGSSRRSHPRTAGPSMSGSTRSRTTASGRNSRAARTAPSPSAALRICQPSYRRAVESRAVTDCSSSTTSTRTGSLSGVGDSVRPWGVVVVIPDTVTGPGESGLCAFCVFAEKASRESGPRPLSRPGPGPNPRPLSRPGPGPNPRPSAGPGRGRPPGRAQAEQPGRVVVADRPQPALPEAQPFQRPQLVEVGVGDVGEVRPEQHPVAEAGQPGQGTPGE